MPPHPLRVLLHLPPQILGGWVCGWVWAGDHRAVWVRERRGDGSAAERQARGGRSAHLHALPSPPHPPWSVEGLLANFRWL